MQAPRRRKPRVGLYASAVVVALAGAGIASQTAFRSEPAVDAMLTVSPRPVVAMSEQMMSQPVVVSQPALAKADRLVTAAQPAVAVAVPSPARAVRVEASLVPPKPQPRPCLRDCMMQSAAATPDAGAIYVEPVQAAEVVVQPQPVVTQLAMAGVEGASGLVSRGSHVVGSIWDWSGNAVGGVVQKVRERTF